MVIILTQDLMMSSSVSPVVRNLGLTFKSMTSLPKLLQLLREQRCSLLLVDLQMAGLNLTELGNGLQTIAQEDRPHCVAYAQHVNVDLLRAARELPIDEVLTRGQIASGLPELVARFATTE